MAEDEKKVTKRIVITDGALGVSVEGEGLASPTEGLMLLQLAAQAVSQQIVAGSRVELAHPAGVHRIPR